MIPKHKLKHHTELICLAKKWGAKDINRVVAGIAKAVENGMPPTDAITSLYKWQPELFAL